MDVDMHAAAAALLNPPLPSPSSTPTPPSASTLLFPRLPETLSSTARLRSGRGLHFWRTTTATLRGSSLILSPPTVSPSTTTTSSSSPPSAASAPAAESTAFDVAGVRELVARGRRLLAVDGSAGESALIEFPDHARERWLHALRRAAKGGEVGLADFEVVRAIGKGGGGRIFLVRRKGSGELLAMKVVEKFMVFGSESGRGLQHAVDERLALQLAGGFPFVVQLRFAFQTERCLYLITEFCSGGDLRAELNRRKGGRMSEEEARPLLGELVLALEFLHSKGIMHRDIKAENILLTSDGRLRLADLGLAKVLKTGRYGRARSFCGTTGYMSPAIAMRRPYSNATDSWSLGVLMFRMLVGRMPFGEKKNLSPLERRGDDAEVLRKIIQDEVDMPSLKSGLLSDEARELILGLLDKDERSRFNLEDIRESRWFAGYDFDKVLDNAKLMTHADSDSLGSEVSDDMGLENFELGRLADVEMNPDEIRDHGSSGSRSGSSVSGAGISSMLKRVTSAGRLRKRPSDTSVIGYAYSAEIDEL